MTSYLERTHDKKGLVEWLKAEALSQTLVLEKKKRKRTSNVCCALICHYTETRF
jgi:hypothetical protein